MAENTEWRVRTADGTEYGPVGYEQLMTWVREGRVSPDSAVSANGKGWVPAPREPALGMTWLVEWAPGRFYGPVHRDVIERMRSEGRLPKETRLFRLADGAQDNSEQVARIQILSASNERLGEALARTAQNEAALRTLMDDIQDELATAKKKAETLRAELAKAKTDLDEARRQKGNAKGGIFSGKSSDELAKLEEAAKRELWMMKLRKAGSEKSLHYGSRAAIDVDSRTVR